MNDCMWEGCERDKSPADAAATNCQSAHETLQWTTDVVAGVHAENAMLRRVIVVLCLLGLGLIAYGFLHNAFLSAATAMAVGAPMGDFL